MKVKNNKAEPQTDINTIDAAMSQRRQRKQRKNPIRGNGMCRNRPYVQTLGEDGILNGDTVF